MDNNADYINIVMQVFLVLNLSSSALAQYVYVDNKWHNTFGKIYVRPLYETWSLYVSSSGYQSSRLENI